MRSSVIPAVAAACVSLFVLSASAQCPPGYAMGGGRCQPKELCPGGTPPEDGNCPPAEGPEAKTQPVQPVPPPSQPEPQPAPQPPQHAVQPAPPIPKTAPAIAKPAPLIAKPAPPRPCEIRTIFAKPTKREQADQHRSVLFVSGSAVELFNRYVRDLRGSGTSVEWDLLDILYIKDDRQLGAVHGRKLSFEEILGGVSQIQHWRKELKAVTAADYADPESLARDRGADLLCGERVHPPSPARP